MIPVQIGREHDTMTESEDLSSVADIKSQHMLLHLRYHRPMENHNANILLIIGVLGPFSVILGGGTFCQIIVMGSSNKHMLCFA